MKRTIILLVTGIAVLIAGKLVIDHLSDLDGFIEQHSAPEVEKLTTGKTEFEFKRFDSAEAALLESQAALEAGFDAEAQAHLKQALNLAPNQPEVLLFQASLELEQNDFSNVVSVATRILDQNATNALALALKGTAEFELGRIEEATATLNKAVVSDSGDTRALHSLGKLHHQLGVFDRARDFYARALETTPNAAGLFEGLHQLFQDQAKESEFPTFVRSLIAQNTNLQAPLLRGLARISSSKNNLTETTRLLKEAAAGGPLSASDLIALADIHYRSLEPELAIDHFDRAIALAPNDPEPLAKRAFSQALLGRTNECISDLSAAFLLRADLKLQTVYNRIVEQFDQGRAPRWNQVYTPERLFPFPYLREFAYQLYDEAELRHPDRRWFIELQRSITLESYVRHDEALAAINRSLALRPTAAAYHHKATILRNQQRYDDALRELDSALQIEPGNAEFWTTKGQIHQWKLETEPAWLAYKEALYHDPDHHPADEALRDMWLASGNHRGLHRDYTAMIARRPTGEFYYRFHRANHLFPLTQYEACLDDLNRALELRPGHEGSRRLRAWALKYMGRYDEALAACEELKRYDFEYHARLLRSTIYVETGRNEEALREIQALMEAGFGGGSPPHLIRARALANLNRPVEAEASYRRQGGPKFIVNRVNTCYVWQIEPPAAEDFERAWFALFAGYPVWTELYSGEFARQQIDQRSRRLWMILVGYFSRLNQGRFEEAEQFLAAHDKTGDECTWPYTMFRYLNGEVPAEVVIARAQEMRGYTRDHTNQPQYGDSHEVLIRSLLGMQALARTNLIAAREQFQWVVDHPNNLQLPAYHYAEARLRDIEQSVVVAATATSSAGQQTEESPIPSDDLNNGLVVHLPLDNDLNDHSTNAYPVTVHGRISLEDGAARFPGDGNFLELPHVPLQRRDFSVSFWVRVDGTNDTCTFFSQKEEDKCGGAIYLQLRQFSQLYLGFWGNDVTAPSSMEPREAWNHVVFNMSTSGSKSG